IAVATQLWAYPEVARQTKFVAGLPVDTGVGGDPGPHTSLGVFLGIKAAVKRALGKDSLSGLHIALQGAGAESVVSEHHPARATQSRISLITYGGRRRTSW
ncbi:MAG: hypothetical protein AAB328_15000, partial [candidate division NC10 bacterium]